MALILASMRVMIDVNEWVMTKDSSVIVVEIFQVVIVKLYVLIKEVMISPVLALTMLKGMVTIFYYL